MLGWNPTDTYRVLSSLMKKTRRSKTLLGSNSGLTFSMRKLHVSNSGALIIFGSRSPSVSAAVGLQRLLADMVG